MMWTVVVVMLLAACQVLRAGEGEAEAPIGVKETGKGPPRGAEQSSLGPGTGGSRSEEWRQRRLQKFQRTQPQLPSRSEKAFLWVEKQLLESPSAGPKSFLAKTPIWVRKTGLSDILHIHSKRFYPLFGTLSTGSGAAAGVQQWRRNLGGSMLDLRAVAGASFRGYQLYNLQLGKIEQTRERFFLYADLRSRHFPQEDFFGIGPGTRVSDRTDFLLEDASYDAVVGYEFNRWIRTFARAGFLQVNIGPGTDRRFANTQDLFDDTSVPGLARQPDFGHLDAALFVDYRDTPGNPHLGGMVGFLFSRLDDRGGREFEFNRFAFDARHYVPLGSVQRVFAIRFFTSLDDADRSSRVPFYVQETLGGGETLRGFRNFRFRDKGLLYLSAEYRWEAAPAVEFAVFYDAGKVFARRADFDFEGLEKSFGGGVRFKTPAGTFLRIEFGRSREGNRFHFRLGPAF